MPKVDNLEHCAQVLLRSELFSGFARSDLGTILDFSRLSVHEKGECIYEKGQPASALYVVDHGIVELSSGPDEIDRRVAIDYVRGGEVFGEIELVDQFGDKVEPKPRFTDATAFETVAFVTVDSRYLWPFLERSPSSMRRLLEVVGRRVRRYDELLRDTTFTKRIEIRIARHLLYLDDFIGVSDGRARRFRRKITQQELADALGISTRSVLNTIHFWEKAGIVDHNKQSSMTLLDVGYLGRISSIRPTFDDVDAIAPVLDDVREALDHGYNIRAHDWANAALQMFPRSVELKHLAILAAARAGATGDALALLKDSYGLDHYHPNEDVSALEPRLLKDLSFQSVDQDRRVALAKESAAKYRAIFERTGGYYPAINAATMFLFAGESARATELAERVLVMLPPTSKGYYPLVSRAEAALILGQLELTQNCLERAAKAADSDVGSVSTTRRQIRRICERQGTSPIEILGALPQASVIHYSGDALPGDGSSQEERIRYSLEVTDGIASALAPLEIGYGFGSLAHGNDILFAEALLERGVKLHVVLPMAIKQFKTTFVEPGGPGWSQRFDDCIERAEGVYAGPLENFDDDEIALYHAKRQSMGLALAKARELEAELMPITVWDGGPAVRLASTGRIVDDWRAIGREPYVVPCPWQQPPEEASLPVTDPFRPVIFCRCDRTDSDQQDMIKSLIDWDTASVGSIGALNDYLYLTLEDASVAANCALKLIEAAVSHRIDMRVACDFGRIGADAETAISGVEALPFLTAKPDTKPGLVFVTEPFFAEVTLASGGSQEFEYVGRIANASNTSRLAMYVLRSKATDAA